MTITTATTVRFRLTGLAGPLAERAGRVGNSNSTARRDLERYYALLARELASIALTEGEAALLCDAGNGTFWEPHTVPLLWAEVDDAVREGLAEKWGVDGPALVQKLRALTPGQQFALVDAVERFWLRAADANVGRADQGGGVEGDLAARLRAVGLVR